MSADLPHLHAEGARVRVSTVRHGDLTPYRLAVEQSRTRLSQWNPVNPDDLVAHLQGQSPSHRTFVIHALDPRGPHGIVGKVNVTNVVRGRFLSAAMGYDAYDPYVGQGLFAEGLRLVVGLALTAEPAGMGLHRLEASVRPGNVASAGVLRSLGFQHEGFSRRLLWLPDGSGREEWRDHDRFALTHEQWPAEPFAAALHRRRVVLVNGIPGSGKTTLASALAAELGLPLLSRDLFGEAGTGDALWRLLEHSTPGAVVDGWFPSEDSPLVRAGLARCGIDASVVPEVWCDAPAAVARERGTRRSLPREPDPPCGAQVGPDGSWDRMHGSARALGLGPTIRVDTSSPVGRRDIVAVALVVGEVGSPRRDADGAIHQVR